MKVRFFVDKQVDAKMLYQMFKSTDPLGAEQRAAEDNIPMDIVKYVQGMKSYELKEDTPFADFVNDYYFHFENILLSSKSAYESEWRKIEDTYFSKVEEITQRPFKYQEYLVCLSAFLIGISNDGDHNMVLVTGRADNPKEVMFLTAYEILMSHLRTILYSMFPDEIEDPLLHLWAIAEATATFILGIDLSGNWEGYQNDYDKLVDSINYKKLKKIIAELKPIYLNRTDFQSYINQMRIYFDTNFKGESLSD